MADLLIIECIIVLALVGLHQAIVAINGRDVPARVIGSPGIDYRDVWTWEAIHGIAVPSRWRGIERRAAKPLTLSSFDTDR